MKKISKKWQLVSTLTIAASILAACGGGGGGGGGSSSNVLYYPYETLYGDACSGYEATPGCTFFHSNGQRIDVAQDPDYNRHGAGSDDMWYVQFNGSGTAADVYNSFGIFQYTTSTANFANFVGGSMIGLGVTGLFWENVAGGEYWLGKNGVLYSANSFASNYGKAINDHSAGDAADNDMVALTSEANEQIVEMGASKLEKDYGFSHDKARAVASALNSWGVAAAERGYTTTNDMDSTFKSAFGVNFSSALAAVKDLQSGDVEKMRDLTNRSAAALGLKPQQAQKFMKGMYKKALASWGYDVDSISW